ncbi:uncharacterized protein LOC141712385 isoform X1 [Apium graveolens]|uniref:uncharacterized protein LOC141712385 isoform X1 n=1 Tax=Apium graveolens TaxID=4045 RepID=UPI003D78DAAD
MEVKHRRQKHETWVSVPQFGGWDLRGDVPGYGAKFSEISETRKQNKRDASRANIGNGAERSLSIISSKPSKARPKGVVSSASKGKPSPAKRNNGMSSQMEKKPNNPQGEVSSAQKVEPTNARPKGGATSGPKSKPTDSRHIDREGKLRQEKPSGGLSSGPKSETTKSKPRGAVSSSLNIEPTKARPSGRVSSRSKNKLSTTVSRRIHATTSITMSHNIYTTGISLI